MEVVYSFLEMLYPVCTTKDIVCDIIPSIILTIVLFMFRVEIDQLIANFFIGIFGYMERDADVKYHSSKLQYTKSTFSYVRYLILCPFYILKSKITAINMLISRQTLTYNKSKRKIVDGIKLGFYCFLHTFILAASPMTLVILNLCNIILPDNDIVATFNLDDSKALIIEAAIIGPIIEEILFRLILRYILSAIQLCLIAIIKDRNNIFVSTNFRIIIARFIFAYVHLDNKGGYLSEKEACMQFISILLTNRYYDVYENTNSLIPGITAHILNNSYVTIVMLLQKSLT